MSNYIFFLIFMGLLYSCNTDENTLKKSDSVYIYCRDNGIHPYTRESTWKASIPHHWTIIEPAINESIADNTKANLTLKINDAAGEIIIYLHTFACTDFFARIPPYMQLQRWIQQFNKLSEMNQSITAQSFNGFSGLMLFAEGIKNDTPQGILAFAMQLGDEHFFYLSQFASDLNSHYYNELKSDFTIKAIGPFLSIENNYKDIVAFAKSIEMIQELQTP